MSSGRYSVIRDLGLVKGGKGLRHHEVVLMVSWRGVVQFALKGWTRPENASEKFASTHS
jgi:hypothetical protein